MAVGLVGGITAPGFGIALNQSSWDASINDLGLTSGVGFNGQAYIVGTAGNTNLDGITVWNVGDIAYFDGVNNVWRKISGTNYWTDNGATISPIKEVDMNNERIINVQAIFFPDGSGFFMESGNFVPIAP